MSGGKLKVDLLPVGAVVGPFQIIEAVHAGTLNGGIAVPAYWYSKSVNFSLFGTGPSFGLDVEGMLGWIHQGGGQQLYDELVQSPRTCRRRSPFGVLPQGDRSAHVTLNEMLTLWLPRYLYGD